MDAAWALYESILKIRMGQAESALIYGFARTENQGSTAAALIYLTMAFSGGSFMPLDSMPL